MTFKEWETSRSPLTGEFEDRDLWRQCWDAAQKEEREACAKVCEDDEMAMYLSEIDGRDYADAIRARSDKEK